MLRSDLDKVFGEVLGERKLLDHPFYQRWQAGQLQLCELSAYAGQYRYFEAQLPAFLAKVVSDLAGSPDAQALVQANLDDELGCPEPHLDLFDWFVAAAARRGGGELTGELHRSPAGSATEVLVGTYQRLATTGPVAALAGLAAYEVQAPGIASTKVEGLLSRYGFSDDEVRFWNVHASMDSGHADWTLDSIGILAHDEDEVRTCATEAAQAWWAFLDERESEAPAPARLVGLG